MHQLKLMILAATVSTLVPGSSPVARSQTTTSPIAFTQTTTSGIIGVAMSQTARLNAYYPGLPAPYATGALCSAQVTFTDDQGNMLKTESITVKPGQSVAVDFAPSTAILSAANGRVELRASVSIALPTPVMPGNPSPMPMPGIVMPVSFCSLSPTLEIFDNDTLKTQILVTDFRLSGLPILAGAVLRSAVPVQ